MVGWAEWRRNHFDHPTFAQGEILSGLKCSLQHCFSLYENRNLIFLHAIFSDFVSLLLFKFFKKKMKKVQFSLLGHPIVNFKKLATNVLLTLIYWHSFYVIRKHSDWHSCQLLANVLATPDCFLLKVVFQSLMGQAIWKRALSVTDEK